MGAADVQVPTYKGWINKGRTLRRALLLEHMQTGILILTWAPILPFHLLSFRRKNTPTMNLFFAVIIKYFNHISSLKNPQPLSWQAFKKKTFSILCRVTEKLFPYPIIGPINLSQLRDLKLLAVDGTLWRIYTVRLSSPSLSNLMYNLVAGTHSAAFIGKILSLYMMPYRTLLLKLYGNYNFFWGILHMFVRILHKYGKKSFANPRRHIFIPS